MQRYPLFCVLCIHLYFCFSFLHLLMIWGTGIELSIEYIYQVFNLLRLIFFPVIILFYILNFANKQYLMIQFDLNVETVEKLQKFAKDVAEVMVNQSKKRPVTAGIAGLLTVTTGAALVHGQNVKETGLKILDVQKDLRRGSGFHQWKILLLNQKIFRICINLLI